MTGQRPVAHGDQWRLNRLDNVIKPGVQHWTMFVVRAMEQYVQISRA